MEITDMKAPTSSFGPMQSMVMKAGRDQAAGALCAAHVPRTGLSPGSPPLLRSAQRPADLIGHRRNTSTRSNPVALGPYGPTAMGGKAMVFRFHPRRG